MDYHVFATKAAARHGLGTMLGWNRPRIAYIYWPEHALATRRGNIIVIQTGDKFLRSDGYVR